MEYQFIEKFNILGYEIKSIFPNAVIEGNYDEPEHLSSFDVYLHGLGPTFDEKNRFYLFEKKVKKRFPITNEIVDKLIALSLIYGGSINMATIQKNFYKNNTFPNPSKLFHHHPTELSAEAEKEKEEYLKIISISSNKRKNK